MLPYLAVFAICAIASLLACAPSRRGNQGFVCFSIFIVLLLSLFAGFRYQVVGTDTQGYALPLYNMAVMQTDFMSFYHQDWFRAWGWSTVDTIEIGYLVFVWISAKLGSFQLLLFLTSFFTVGPFYLALAMRREVSLPFGLFMFMFLYFNVTLNAMRQWIAIAFIFLALVGVYDSAKCLRSQPSVILLLVVAFLFHSSALLGAIPFLLMLFLKRGNTSIRLGIVVVVSVIALFSVNGFRVLLIDHGFVRYANYLGDGNTQLSVPQLVLRVPFLVVAGYLYKSGYLEKKEAAFYLCMAVIGLLCGQFSTLTEQSGRIGQYFDIYFLFAASILAKPTSSLSQGAGLIDGKITIASLFPVFVALYCIAYWCYSYVLMNSGETIPYVFFWS
ncbi:MAG: EpsG family protein [Eggerthellaceae bacterium]|nr:EpsG family protein [Eggerthellaceae bacterium]